MGKMHFIIFILKNSFGRKCAPKPIKNEGLLQPELCLEDSGFPWGEQSHEAPSVEWPKDQNTYDMHRIVYNVLIYKSLAIKYTCHIYYCIFN